VIGLSWIEGFSTILWHSMGFETVSLREIAVTETDEALSVIDADDIEIRFEWRISSLSCCPTLVRFRSLDFSGGAEP